MVGLKSAQAPHPWSLLGKTLLLRATKMIFYVKKKKKAYLYFTNLQIKAKLQNSACFI